MAADSRDDGIVDEIHRVCCPSVLRDAVCVVVGLVRVRVDYYVLKYATKADGVEYLGFVFLRELNTLCVASPLKVENAINAPSMFVVANQPSCRIGGKRGLASS